MAPLTTSTSDFSTEDVYTPAEGFTGFENTHNVSAWAYPSP